MVPLIQQSRHADRTQSRLRVRASVLVEELVERYEAEGRLTIGELVECLGSQAMGLLVLILAFPNCLPVPNPPGFSALTGLPIVLVAGHLLLGRQKLWLPQAASDYALHGGWLPKMLRAGLPYLRRAECCVRPRLSWMFSRGGKAALGAGMLLLALMMSLPIPWGNFIPGLALVVIAIGLLERDGAVILVGLLGGLTAAALFSTVLASAAMQIWDWMLGMKG